MVRVTNVMKIAVVLTLLLTIGKLTIHTPGTESTQTIAGTTAPRDEWVGDRIRASSQNWYDSVIDPAASPQPERVWSGNRIRTASQNWADPIGAQADLPLLQQSWSGEKIRIASENWADYYAPSTTMQFSN